MAHYECRIYSGAPGKDSAVRDIGRILRLLDQEKGIMPRAMTPALGKEFMQGLNALGRDGWMTIGFLPGSGDALLMMRIVQ